MSVRIEKYINTSAQELLLKKRNIFIGISLGNKYFSGPHVREFICWAFENTKEEVLVVIADKNHAINYEVLNGYSAQRALDVALRRGREKRKEIEDATRDLPESYRKRLRIIGWDGAQNTLSYKENIEAIWAEFDTNPEFQEYILGIIGENVGKRSIKISLEGKKRLARYVLDELPSLLCGIEYEGKRYDLHPYPGFSSFDYLLEGLGNKTLFPELAYKIRFDNKPAIVEMFVV